MGMFKVACASSVGFGQFELNSNEDRPLKVTIWYPTKQTSPIISVAENIAFVGTDVIKHAALPKQKYPLVLLSHGYRGSWRNLNWLATKLALKGFIVAAPDHPGTTTYNHLALQASQWWQRPQDLVRVLNYLLEDPAWRTAIDPKNVSAVGHSLGGWSVMQLVGAKFDRNTFNKQCRQYPNPRTCGLASELGLSSPQPQEPKSFNFYDARITKAVILDLGLARSFTITSLNNVNTAVMILGAGVDIGDLPQALESGYLAEHLPLLNRRYKVYEQATHFSFMQLCKPNAVPLLEEETPGDGIVCKDGADTTRQVLHSHILEDILNFITN
ncbi:MAG: alpha/beta fold hydrolase [Gammaproteobacteria bacterium]|nr:alpha/beta fold hydrolase [Gammaproteobacteria bacterium]